MITSRNGSSVTPVPGCGKQENEVSPHNSEENSATSILGSWTIEELEDVTQSTSSAQCSSKSPGAAEAVLIDKAPRALAAKRSTQK